MTKRFLCFRRCGVVAAALAALAVVAACSGAQTPVTSEPAAASTPPAPEIVSQPDDLMRDDSQGTVTVQVTPLNLDSPAASLDFDVVLDTHSVNLAMDLTQMAVLRTDTGAQVSASAWPIGTGHHYEATLSFPAQTGEGKRLLEGASTLSLVIVNLDAPERVFEWSLAQ